MHFLGTFHNNQYLTSAGLYQLSDYPTFGSPMPTRQWSDPNSKYKYGFNGMEKDDDINVNGGSYDFGARIYDSRLGRWLSLDPLMVKYPNYSPYNFVLNSPLAILDVDGRDVVIGNISNFNQLGLNAIVNSIVISNFISQFASTNSGSQLFYGNSPNPTSGQYASSVNLNINSIDRNSVQGAAMIAANQDAQTTFSYTLSDGTTVAAAAYIPVAGVTVVSASINLNVLSGNLLPSTTTAGTDQNFDCLAAAYTSVALVNELYSSVDNFTNLLNANTVGGVVNYAGVTAALAGGGPPPVSPALAAAQNDLVNKNSNTTISPFVQIDNYTGTTFLCRSTFSLGSVIQNQAIAQPPGSIATESYVSPGGMCPRKGPSLIIGSNCWSEDTPDDKRDANQTISTKCD